jgi:glycosyltransferase involved in cell wall biosynthesis
VTEIDVVLPCLNEAAGLAWVLERLPAWAHPVVVDNGSTDGTADVARSAGVPVVSAPERGYGAACAAGLDAATRAVVAVIDADGTIHPAELEQAAAPVLAGEADLVVGRRRVVVAAYGGYATYDEPSRVSVWYAAALVVVVLVTLGRRYRVPRLRSHARRAGSDQ